MEKEVIAKARKSLILLFNPCFESTQIITKTSSGKAILKRAYLLKKRLNTKKIKPRMNSVSFSNFNSLKVKKNALRNRFKNPYPNKARISQEYVVKLKKSRKSKEIEEFATMTLLHSIRNIKPPTHHINDNTR
jgi:hypothetical protein